MEQTVLMEFLRQETLIATVPTLAAAIRTTNGYKPVVAESMLRREDPLVQMYHIHGRSISQEAEMAASTVSGIAERLRRLASAYGEWDLFDAPAYFDLSVGQTAHLVKLTERVSPEVAALRGMRVERTSLRLILVGVGGALLGSGALLLAELPDSPFPPAVISPLCGSAMALAAYCVLSRSVLYAWTFAWVLAVVASRSEPRPDVMACCVLLLICTLFPMAQRARLFRTGLAGVAGVVVFSVAMAGAVTAAVEASLALEGTLTSALYRLLSNLPIRGGVALQDDISLLSLSAVEPDDRPLCGQPGCAPRCWKVLTVPIGAHHRNRQHAVPVRPRSTRRALRSSWRWRTLPERSLRRPARWRSVAR